ncbi:MAG TPA: M81 family metallopeptidase [Kofleriaceae bacterium]|nr:M81 family metallopeptidase [Kofleriaceae bacterium]
MSRRLACARIMQESNALCPVPTELADFEDSHYLEGDALRAALRDGGHEVAGFFRKAELAGFCDAIAARGDAVPVPLLSAWASSGGPLSRACFDGLVERLTASLRRARADGGLDGVYLALHGALGVAGVRDPESVLIREARAAAGAPVVVSHDLHANLTRARVEAADAIVGYQTNPHRDHARTGRKAGELLAGIAAGELRPEVAWRSLPILLGGGKTIDFLAPMRAVFRRMRAAERRGHALSASTFMVHPWNDDPALGWSTLAIADRDRGAAERLADELAELCWARRHEQPPAFLSAEEAIAQARAARVRRALGVVMMADASDVVTAGAPGDSTHLLRALVLHGGGLRTYAAVRDPDTIAAVWPRAAGDTVDVTLGGKLDPVSGPPLAVRARVASKHELRGFRRVAVLEVGDLRVVVTEGPAMVMRPAFYKDVGLSIWDADIVVVKNFFPFLLFFAPYNRKTLFVRTRGATDFDAAYRLTFDGPIHPRDPVDDWRPRDRLRRGLA